MERGEFHPLEEMLSEENDSNESVADSTNNKKETVIDRERKRHNAKKTSNEELPSIIIETDLESPVSPEKNEATEEKIIISSSEKTFEFEPHEEVLYTSLKGKEMSTIIVDKSKDSSNPGLILKNTKTGKVFAVNAESVAKRVRKLKIDNLKDSREDVIENPEIHSTEELQKEEKTDATEKKQKNKRTKGLSSELSRDTEIQSLITEWKENQGKKTKAIISDLEAAQFLHWILQEKEGQISEKNYEKVYEVYEDETDPEIKSQAQESYIEEQEEKEQKKISGESSREKVKKMSGEKGGIIVDPKVYQEEKVQAAKKRIADLPNGLDNGQSADKAEKLRSYREQIRALYEIVLDEEGNPATPKDETKIAKTLGLIDDDVKAVQRGGILGKVKGFFQDIGVSDKDKMKARAFKKDLSEYMQLVLKDAKPRYGSDGPISRAMIRERGSVGTPVGSIETARHSPVRRGRPPKTKV